MASLQGTTEYLIDTDNGESITEAQILANATIKFKTGVNASEQTLAWTDSRVAYSWNPDFAVGEPGNYEMTVTVLGTTLGTIRVIAIGGELGSTAPEPPQLEIPDPPQPGLTGDVDGNGVVNVTDALLALRFAMGVITLDADQIARGDMDGNGVVNATDAINIMRIALNVQ